MTGIHDSGGTVEFLLIAVGAAILLYMVVVRGRKQFWRLMEEINRVHGTAFPTTPSGMHLVLCGRAGQVFVFDQKNRKIFFVTSLAQHKGELLDFSYIRHWVKLWDQGTSATGDYASRNLRFEFATTDIRRPTITIPAGSSENADEWDRKLYLILKHNA